MTDMSEANARRALKAYISRHCAAGITAEVSGMISALIAAVRADALEQGEARELNAFLAGAKWCAQVDDPCRTPQSLARGFTDYQQTQKP